MANLPERAIDRVIRQNLGKLRKPGVLTVRPGFEIAAHQLTGRSAIVATVQQKRTDLARQDLLPTRIAGVPVDVREATAHQRLRARDPAAAKLTQAFGRPEDVDPDWPRERELPSGKLLTDNSSNHQHALQRNAVHQPAVAKTMSARQSKPQIPYVAAAGALLAPIRTVTTITAHVSPDAGFTQLSSFLKQTQKSLVLGMYDFTSGPILEIFKQVLTAPKTLQMVLDNPPLNGTANQSDTETVTELQSALGTRAAVARALTRGDTFAADWMFPSAYHIKVIVRDDTAFWLSSGNLNNSNQPDPALPAPKTEDRDWHVIIEDPQLAKLFAAYLDQDYQSAASHQATPNPVVAEALSVANAKLDAERSPAPAPADAARKAAVPFAPQVFKGITVTITPLLTPDPGAPPSAGEYLTKMTALIQSAKKSLYVQLQYIEAATAADYQSLLQTIADRVTAGVDVRLIEDRENGEKWAEKMKQTGVDLTANIALQSSVHNKGFVIDSSTVVVSSQNFSPEGVRQNRDAGVIIESPAVAQYFEQVFLADWNTRAKPFAPSAAGTRKAKKSASAATRKAVRRHR
jgi:phosphatidylserine/phosphatidylglycerophosphate/cardiolipin synthase-like enzyme